MSLSDPVADMLTKIRNASRVKFEKVDVTASKLQVEVVKVLKNEGFIKNFKKINQNSHNCIRIFLKYDDQEIPVIHGIDRISKPGRRIYAGYKNMPRILNGYGIVIITTSFGVTTGKKAVENKAGGELICSVW